MVVLDISDILPLLIIIVGGVLSFIGKSSKKKGDEVPTQKHPQRRAAAQPRPPRPRQVVTVDDWIPVNEVPPMPASTVHSSSKQTSVIQLPEREGVRTIPADYEVLKPLSANVSEQLDPNYAKNDIPSASSTHDWRKAIIAHEILKTKF